MSDRYEVRARLLPGAFATAPLAVAAYAVGARSAGFLTGAGAAATVEILMMLLAGHIARVLGAGYESKLFNGVLPTETWLGDGSPRSRQQQQQWATAIQKLTGFDIRGGDAEERRRVAADALAQLRGRLRGDDAMKMTQVFNEDYGFARNLAGLVPVWLASAVCGAAVCLAFAAANPAAWLGFSIDITLAVAAVAYGLLAERAVRWAADRFAEAFLSAVVVIAQRDAPKEG